jgi:serine/threonine protein kinase
MGEAEGRLVAGRYRLVASLGEGGMGVAWQARDEHLDRDVVLKQLVLPAGLRAEERRTLTERMQREARAAGRLKHPAIVTVHDQISDGDGLPWIVMELVRGPSLAAIVREAGPLPPARVARIGAQLAGALAAAHAAGIVHRDVKPANVLVEGDRVVLTDFGIAAWEGDLTLTPSGVMIGTPAYMAPEQVHGQASSPASDVWSLGATLYTAVEGRPAFAAPTTAALLLAISLGKYPPPERAGPLQEVLEQLMRLDPGQRPSATKAAAALADLELGSERTATFHKPLPYHEPISQTEKNDSKPPRKPWLPIVAIALLVAAVAVVALVLRNWADDERTPAHAPATQARGQSATPQPSDHPFNQEIYRDASWALTLIRVRLAADGSLTTYVRYQNLSPLPAALECSGVTDPKASTLLLSRGRTLPSKETYCSRNPSAVLAVKPGQSFQSYATFPPSDAYGEPFTLNWQPQANYSGTAPNIDLS